MKITHYGVTHPGCLRETNEDALLLMPETPFFAVADGLGGLPDGDIAANAAVDYLKKHLQDYLVEGNLRMKDLFEATNTHVYALGLASHAGVGIGTTLTGVAFRDDSLFAGHVGDSSLYLFRDGKFHIVTEEHTMAAELGGGHDQKQNRAIPEFYYHTLTRCIGAAPEVEISLEELKTEPGDRLLLSTDGLIKVASSALITEAMATAKNTQNLVEALLEFALENGCPDNITLVAIFLEED